MRMSLDCIPCFIRQALEAARMTSSDQAVHHRIMSEVLQWASDINLEQPAPLIGQRIHRRLREIVGIDDPYRQAKDHQNRMALAMLPEMRAKINSSNNPLQMATRLAIAGNVIDMGIPGQITDSSLRATIEKCLTEPLLGCPESFWSAAGKSGHILYLADNAGEIVFDRLLIEQLAPAKVTLAVRGGAAINDATLPDAAVAGIAEVAEVIDNGSDAPGTILADCSRSFKDHFAAADLIISKGQGNYETLSDTPGNIFFLFKAKCQVIAEHAGVRIGSHIVCRRPDRSGSEFDSSS